MKLPDVNLLVAMSSREHAMHEIADRWRKANPQFATCPITELGLVRILMVLGADEKIAQQQLSAIIRLHRAVFFPCDDSAAVISGKIFGHRQVTDAYLLELAKKNHVTLATLDTHLKGAELVQ